MQICHLLRDEFAQNLQMSKILLRAKLIFNRKEWDSKSKCLTPDLRCHLTSKKGKSCNKCVWKKLNSSAADALDHLSVWSFIFLNCMHWVSRQNIHSWCSMRCIWWLIGNCSLATFFVLMGALHSSKGQKSMNMGAAAST